MGAVLGVCSAAQVSVAVRGLLGEEGWPDIWGGRRGGSRKPQQDGSADGGSSCLADIDHLLDPLTSPVFIPNYFSAPLTSPFALAYPRRNLGKCVDQLRHLKISPTFSYDLRT